MRLPCFIPCVKGGVQKCHMMLQKYWLLKQGTLNFDKPEHPDCQEVDPTSPNLSTKINFTRPNASGEDQMTPNFLLHPAGRCSEPPLNPNKRRHNGLANSLVAVILVARGR